MIDAESIVSRIEEEAYRYLLAHEDNPGSIFISMDLYAILAKVAGSNRMLANPNFYAADGMLTLIINLPFCRSSIYPIEISSSDFIMAGKDSDVGRIAQMMVDKEFEKVFLEEKT